MAISKDCCSGLVCIGYTRAVTSVVQVLLLYFQASAGLILLSLPGSELDLNDTSPPWSTEGSHGPEYLSLPESRFHQIHFPVKWKDDDITLISDTIRSKKTLPSWIRRLSERRLTDIFSDKPLKSLSPKNSVQSDFLVRNLNTIHREASIDLSSTGELEASDGQVRQTHHYHQRQKAEDQIPEQDKRHQINVSSPPSQQHRRRRGYRLLSVPSGVTLDRSSLPGRQQEIPAWTDNYDQHRSSTMNSIKQDESDGLDKESHDLSPETSRLRSRRSPSDASNKIQVSTLKSGLGQKVTVRQKSQVQAKIGVLVVVENSVYRQYLKDNGNNPRAALARLRRYYGMVFSMMDQRFKTIKDPHLSVSVSISGILVAEKREDSGWLEQMVDWSSLRGHGRGSVLTDRALKKFTKWISGQTDLPDFDHAMVFTAYRLTNKQGVSLGGMAYLSAICDTKSGNAVSIVADLGDFQCVKVATHELAHSLGAYHDGDQTTQSCRANSNYVMSPLTAHENHVLRNAFYFSPCSIRDMTNQLSQPSSACVRDEPPVYYSYDLQRLPPGRLYSADMQCRLIFGRKSGFCREGNLVDVMCGQLWCRDPDKGNGCRTNTYLTALPGTECGHNKVCHLGECVMDTGRISAHKAVRNSATGNATVESRWSWFRTHAKKPSHAKKPAHAKKPTHAKKPANAKRPTHLRSNQTNDTRTRKKRRNSCHEDQNANYCQGLVRLNPGGCDRPAIHQYCCHTCRVLHRLRPRDISID